MYNEIQSQRGQQSILVFQWRLTSENVNAQIVKNASNTLGIRVAELGKRVAQTVISGVELHWGYVLIHYVIFQNHFWEIFDILSYVFVHADVWYFNHKRRFRLVIFKWFGLMRFIIAYQNMYRCWLEMCYFIWYKYSFQSTNICRSR